MKKIKSLMPYIGSKALAMESIYKLLPSDIKEYREPMIGGGSILIGLMENAKLSPDTTIKIGDANKLIYSIWNLTINYPELMIKLLQEIQLSLDSHFDWQEVFNEDIDFEEWVYSESNKGDAYSAALELIICKLRRYGNFGELSKSKVARLKNNREDIIHNLIEKIEIIDNLNYYKDIKVYNEDYSWALKDGDSSTLVVLDPPYLDVKTTDEYYKGHHFNFDYYRFNQLLRDTKCKFIVTCDMGMLEYVGEFNCSINPIYYKMSQKVVEELIVTNF